MKKSITSFIMTLAVILSICLVYAVPAIAATAPSGYATDEHGILAHSTSSKNYGYDVKGYVDGSWRQVTYSNGGLAACVYNGSGISVSAPTFEFVADGQGMLMTYTLTNTSASTVSNYRFSISADTMVNGNDHSTNTVNDDVLTMSYSGVSFFGFSITEGATIIPTNYNPGFWNVANSGTDPSAATAVYTDCDSAFVLYFDQATLAPGASAEYTFVVGMGDSSVIDSIINAVKKAVMNAKTDFQNECLTDLDAGATYEITCDGETFTVIASENGTIPLSGTDKNGKTYELIGKTISIVRKAGGEYTEDSDPQEVDISDRPDTPDSPSAPVTADKPAAVSSDQLETDTNKITVISPTVGQEYSIDNGATWKKYTGTETIEFTGLTPDTEYSVITRVAATEESFHSDNSDPCVVKTQVMLKNVTVNKTDYTGIFDGNQHTIDVSVPDVPGATIDYSKEETQNYSATPVYFTNVGQYTVYYRISAEGYYPAYGYGTVTITQATPEVTPDLVAITYGDALNRAIGTAGTAVYGSTTVPGIFTFANGDTTYPAVSDSGTTLYALTFTPYDTNYAPVTKDVNITVNKAAQAAPNATATNETYEGKADGTITGLTDAMEYKLSTADTWTAVPGGSTQISNLTAGTYQVRMKEDANHFASPAQEIVISTRKANVTLSSVNCDANGYTIFADKTTCAYNEEVTITYQLKEGYNETETPVVTLNGSALTLDGDGKCTVHILADSEIVVHGVLDRTAPTGEITIAESKWEQFVNVITFGLFYKDAKTVTIVAADAGSGVKSIEYYRTDVVYNAEEIKAVSTWTGYTAPIAETAVDGEKFTYYVRLTDNAGNVTYISSDGANYDVTAPVITGVTDGAEYHTTQTVTVTDDNIDTITVNGNAVTSPAALPGDTDATYVIVATDKAGNQSTCTITMRSIASIGSPIEDLTEENVKSSDKEKLEQILAIIDREDDNAPQEEKDALREIADKCEKLLEKIDNTKDALEDACEDTDAFDPETITSDDLEKIEETKEAIESIDRENLTEEEKKLLDEKQKLIEELLERAETLGEIEKVLEGVDEICGITLDSPENIDRAARLIADTIDSLKSYNGSKDNSGNSTIIETLSENGYVEVILKNVKVVKRKNSSSITYFFDVNAYMNGEQVHTLPKAVSFRLPVTESGYKYVNVYHEGKFIGQYTVQGNYVELSSNEFSEYRYTLTNTKYYVPGTGDSTNVGLLIALAAVSALGLCIVLLRKRRTQG